MLLRYALGEEKAAQRIEAAVMGALDKGFRTGDIMSPGMVPLFLFYFKSIIASVNSFNYCVLINPFTCFWLFIAPVADCLPYVVRLTSAARKWETSCSRHSKLLNRLLLCTKKERYIVTWLRRERKMLPRCTLFFNPFLRFLGSIGCVEWQEFVVQVMGLTVCAGDKLLQLVEVSSMYQKLISSLRKSRFLPGAGMHAMMLLGNCST